MGALTAIGVFIKKNTFEGGAHLKGITYWKKDRALNQIVTLLFSHFSDFFCSFREIHTPCTEGIRIFLGMEVP